MKRCFVLRKYIFFRWGKKTLNKGFGRNLPFCRTYVLGCWGRFLLRISVGGCAFRSRVLFSFYSFVGGDEEVARSSFVWKTIRMSRLLCIEFFFLLPSVFSFDSLIFTCFGVLQFSCKYIFIYLCVNILQSAMGLIISSPPLSQNVLSLNIILGWLFVFLSYNLAGYRFVFTLYSFLFYQ